MNHYNVPFSTQIYSSYFSSPILLRLSTCTRASTSLCLPLTPPFLFRSMLSNSRNVLSTITSVEKQEVAKAVLCYFQLLKKAHVVQDISKKSLENSYNQVYEYLNSDNSNIQVRTTLLSAFGEPKLNLKKIANTYNNPLLNVPDNNILVPIRSLAESYVINNFSTRFEPYIKNVLLTGDTIKTISKINPHEDFIVNFIGNPFINSTRSFDVKCGNFDKDAFFKGHIRQVTYYKSQEISYPNKKVCLDKEHYEPLVKRLLSKMVLDQAKLCMESQEFEYLNNLLNKPFFELIKTKSYQELENILIEIQRIPSFPKAFNFVNIHNIQDQPFTDKEMAFLNSIIPFISPNILDNPRNMQQFLSQALVKYNFYLDNNIRKTIEPLKENQRWIKTALDQMDTDIFTS